MLSVYIVFSIFMQARKRKISRKAETKAATRLHVINLQQPIGRILNPSSLLSSSTDHIESEHDEESGCDRDNVEKSSFAETQENSNNDITAEGSDGNSRGSSSDSEYESDVSESSDTCEAVDVEDLRALRDDNEERNAYILRELKKQ